MRSSTMSIIPTKNTDTLAAILRDKKSKAAVLQVSESKPWQLFAGPTSGGINYANPILEGFASGSYPIPVDNHIHYCFSFTTGRNKLILAEKQLPMDGGYNFRDMGGIRTRYGKKICWGKLFRSDELINLTVSDLEYLASIPITTIVDFRSLAEIKHTQDQIPSSVKKYLPLSIAPGSIDIETIEKALDGATQSTGADNIMVQVYEQLILDVQAQKAFKDFFASLEEKENLPLLFHCTAGKDRTGMAAALLLFALGVDEQTVMQDYLASKVYLEGKYPSNLDIFTVKAEFLQTAIDTINQNYNNVEDYLVKILGVNINKLRKLYLI